jgi:hypothetical protein
MESTNLLTKNGKWYLIVNASMRSPIHHWVFESDRMDKFDFKAGREFWKEAGCIEVVKERGSKALLAGLINGIRFGEVDWSDETPTAHTIETREQLKAWQD